MNAPTGTIQPETPRGRVLIIDDASTIRRYHRMIVEQAGFEASEAFNGIEAIEIALSHPHDLFLVDVNMPEMNGYRFLEEARQNPDLWSTPAIMVSTEAEAADADKAFALGASYYMIKPALPEHLSRCLELLIAGGAK